MKTPPRSSSSNISTIWSRIDLCFIAISLEELVRIYLSASERSQMKVFGCNFMASQQSLLCVVLLHCLQIEIDKPKWVPIQNKSFHLNDPESLDIVAVESQLTCIVGMVASELRRQNWLKHSVFDACRVMWNRLPAIQMKYHIFVSFTSGSNVALARFQNSEWLLSIC